MVEKIKHLLREPLVRVLLLIAFLTVVGGAGWGIYTTQVPPEQPIQFPHKTHIALGVQCIYCHPGAWRQASAGLPTATKCWGCHQQVAKQTPELDKLKQYVANSQPIAWVPVAQVPDFVHFNHRPHIAAGLNCENCHGDMSQLTVAQNPQVMNMGWCLNCHRARAGDDQEKLIRLTDCATCHY
jgi:hypothetical protein